MPVVQALSVGDSVIGSFCTSAVRENSPWKEVGMPLRTYELATLLRQVEFEVAKLSAHSFETCAAPDSAQRGSILTEDFC